MKRTFSEIVIIIVFSIALALFFNYLDPDGINIFEKKKPNETVNDTELFGEETRDSENTVIDEKTNSQSNIEEKDAISEEKKSENIKNDSKNENSNEIVQESIAESEHPSNNIDDEIKSVSFSQMQKIANDTSFIIIDARSPELFEEDRIGNAINIFPFADDQNQVIEQIFQLPYGKKIIVYCDGGNCDASHLIAEMLLQFDYNDIYLYSGGWEEWIKKR
jgi:rhodanese-related sulfurtransferase